MTPATPDAPSPAAVTAFLRGLDRRARLFASVQAGDALAAQAQLVGQQFLQRQPPLRRMQAGLQRGHVGVARRPMQGHEGVAQARQLQGIAHLQRQQLQRIGIRQALQRKPDQLAQVGRPDALDPPEHRA